MPTQLRKETKENIIVHKLDCAAKILFVSQLRFHIFFWVEATWNLDLLTLGRNRKNLHPLQKDGLAMEETALRSKLLENSKPWSW